MTTTLPNRLERISRRTGSNWIDVKIIDNKSRHKFPLGSEVKIHKRPVKLLNFWHFRAIYHPNEKLAYSTTLLETEFEIIENET